MGNSTLTIIVHPDIQFLGPGKTLSMYNTEGVSIGKRLSEFLVESEESDRGQATIKWLKMTLRGKAPGPIVCADIDLLFDPSLGLDPLIIFRHISQHTSLIILWPGIHKDSVLSYAQPEHQHYRFWKNLEGLEIKGVSDAL